MRYWALSTQFSTIITINFYKCYICFTKELSIKATTCIFFCSFTLNNSFQEFHLYHNTVEKTDFSRLMWKPQTTLTVERLDACVSVVSRAFSFASFQVAPQSHSRSWNLLNRTQSSRDEVRERIKILNKNNGEVSRKPWSVYTTTRVIWEERRNQCLKASGDSIHFAESWWVNVVQTGLLPDITYSAWIRVRSISWWGIISGKNIKILTTRTRYFSKVKDIGHVQYLDVDTRWPVTSWDCVAYIWSFLLIKKHFFTVAAFYNCLSNILTIWNADLVSLYDKNCNVIFYFYYLFYYLLFSFRRLCWSIFSIYFPLHLSI